MSHENLLKTITKCQNKDLFLLDFDMALELNFICKPSAKSNNK